MEALNSTFIQQFKDIQNRIQSLERGRQTFSAKWTDCSMYWLHVMTHQANTLTWTCIIPAEFAKQLKIGDFLQISYMDGATEVDTRLCVMGQIFEAYYNGDWSNYRVTLAGGDNFTGVLGDEGFDSRTVSNWSIQHAELNSLTDEVLTFNMPVSNAVYVASSTTPVATYTVTAGTSNPGLPIAWSCQGSIITLSYDFVVNITSNPGNVSFIGVNVPWYASLDGGQSFYGTCVKYDTGAVMSASLEWAGLNIKIVNLNNSKPGSGSYKGTFIYSL